MSDLDSFSHGTPSCVASGPSKKNVDECLPCGCDSLGSGAESISTTFPYIQDRFNKVIDYKTVKARLKESSSVTGESLYDHLVEIIKRVIDERPANVVDYFEQFSRHVRDSKLDVTPLNHSSYCEPDFLLSAKSILKLLKVPYAEDNIDFDEQACEYVGESALTYGSDSTGTIQRNLSQCENVIQLQHFWGLCGLGFQIDEVFQLSLAVQKIQFHYAVEKARFWGRIYGLKGSYYIVEADLNVSEIEIRRSRMKLDLLKNMVDFLIRKNKSESLADIDLLTPGVSWQYYPNEDLMKMKPAGRIPELKLEEIFDIIPEPVGVGLNRKAYFVTTSLNKDWQELPIVTPNQIIASRKIKKFFTGDLDASLNSYPTFPGTEKNYLRAMIARITAGTYIAPVCYYRKMNRKERLMAAGEFFEEEEGDEEAFDDESEEEEFLGNDVLITPDLNYDPIPMDELPCLDYWVHVRPNILNQGRVIYINQEEALKELEKKALAKLKADLYIKEEGEENEAETEEDLESRSDEEGEEEELIPDEESPPIEVGPAIFTPCSRDEYEEDVPPWTPRYSSVYSTTNQMIMMRSNLWPGATTFAFENFCDSIYLGWGSKFVPRCVNLQHVPAIHEYEYPCLKTEVADPTVAMEDAWHLYHRKKEFPIYEDFSNLSIEFDIDDEEDDTH